MNHQDRSHDPYGAYRFKIVIDGVNDVGGFSDASGLSFETDVETFREGGYNAHERQLPGAAKASGRLVLKRGLGKRTILWDWFRDVSQGKIKRHDLSVTLIDPTERGADLRVWRFIGACPVKWVGPELHAKTSDISIESIEFVHQGQVDLGGSSS